MTHSGSSRAPVPEVPSVSTKARAPDPSAMMLDVDGLDDESKAPKIWDSDLTPLIKEMFAAEGSLANSLGDGPLPQAIMAERRAGRSFTQRRKGQWLMGALQEWLWQTIKKIQAEVINGMPSDIQAAEDAIEELQFVLGVLAKDAVSDLDDEDAAALAPLAVLAGASQAPPQEQMWSGTAEYKALAKPTEYIVDTRHECILHGSKRIFERDEIRSRVRAIKVMLGFGVEKMEPQLATDMFVEAVVMDLEAEREKHPGLSRDVLGEWATAIYKARLMECVEQGRVDRDKLADGKQRFERSLWIAIARRFTAGAINTELHDVVMEHDFEGKPLHT